MGFKKVNFEKNKQGKSNGSKKKMEPNKKPKYKKQWS
jgi:hypothetical protein